jgi:Ca2+-binding EF-hand superfamily protein
MAGNAGEARLRAFASGKDELWAMIDSNHDEFITKQEVLDFVTALKANGDDGARDVATLAEDFVQRADMGQDGKISKQEFMDILELQIEVARVEHENKAIFYKFMRPMAMRQTTTDR